MISQQINLLDVFNVKVCTMCGLEKPLSDFNNRKESNDLLTPRCKKCNVIARDQWRKRNKDFVLQASREYRTRNRDRIIKTAKRWCQTHREVLRFRHLKNTYGLTREGYESLLRQQNGVCAICNKPETAKTNHGHLRNLSVDHSHKTGKVRALLCSVCNRALGYVKEDLKILSNMRDYIIKHQDNLA